MKCLFFMFGCLDEKYIYLSFPTFFGRQAVRSLQTFKIISDGPWKHPKVFCFVFLGSSSRTRTKVKEKKRNERKTAAVSGRKLRSSSRPVVVSDCCRSTTQTHKWRRNIRGVSVEQAFLRGVSWGFERPVLTDELNSKLN